MTVRVLYCGKCGARLFDIDLLRATAGAKCPACNHSTLNAPYATVVRDEPNNEREDGDYGFGVPGFRGL